MTREELKAKIREKKIRRAFKIMRFRSLKNFFIWLTGAMMSFVIFFLTVFVAVGVVPIGTYTGGESDEVVGEAISDKSLYQAIMDFNTYKIGDIPALSNALTQIINESGLDQYVDIDVDKLNKIKFVYDDGSTDMMTELTSCIKVTASIETVMSATDGSSGLGDFGNLSVFSSYGEIAEYVKAKVKTNDNGLVNDDPANHLNAEDYYYFDSVNEIYSRAFDSDDSWVDAIVDKPDVLYVKNKDLPQVDTNGDITKNAEGEFNSNPKLYYYDANSVEDAEGGANPMTDEVKEPKWERAFDDNGKRVAPLNVKLHYANLSKVPILEAIDLIDESLGRLELTELLETFGAGDMTSEDSLLGSILGDKSVGDMASIGTSDIFLAKILPATEEDVVYKIMTSATGKAYDAITIDDLTGTNDDGSAKLDITKIGLSSLLEASEDDIINKILTSATGKPYDQITVDDLTGTNDDGSAKLDINRIGIGMLLEASEDDIIYKILTSATNTPYDQITIGDLTGTNDDGSAKLDINRIGIGVLLEVDKDDVVYKILMGATGAKTFDDITIGDLTGEDENGKPLLNINDIQLSTFITASEEDTIYKILMGATGAKTFDDITIGDLTGTNGDGTPKLDINKVAIGTIMTGEDNEVVDMLVDMINEKREAEAGGQEFTAVTAETLTIGDIQSVDTSYIKLTSFMPYYEVNGEQVDDNRELYKILLEASGKALTKVVDGQTINLTDDEIKALADDLSLSNLTFDIDNVKLSTVMSADKKLQGILSGALKDKAYSEITIADLSSEDFKIDNVHLSSVMDLEEDDMLYKILDQAIEGGYENVKISSLSNLSLDNVELSSVMTVPTSLQKIFDDLYKNEIVTIGKLKTLSFDDVHLSSVMELKTTDTLYMILNQAYDGYENVTISSLSNLKLDNVKLSTVLPYKDSVKNVDNSQLYKILLDCKGMLKSTDTDTEISAKAQSLSISDINNFSIDNVRLLTVLTSPDNSLKSILEDVYVGQEINVGDKQVLVNSYEDITLSMLASFKMEDLHLYKVLPEPSGNLKSILEDAFDCDYDEITVSKLSGNGFTFDKVSLKTVVGETSSNPIIQALIESGSSVGGIGDAINKLSLYKVYGANIFTTTPVENSPRYTLSEDKTTYMLDDNGKYYLSKNAGIWLLICFDSSTTLSSDEINHKGRPISYTVSSATIADLQGGNENSVDISSAFSKATVRQLIDAGLVTSAKKGLYAMTLSGVLNLGD